MTPSTYDGLRDRWNTVLTGGTTYNPADPDIARQISANASEGQGYWNTLDKSAGRTTLWANMPTTTSSGDVTGTYYNLKVMTLAYVQRGSSLKGNVALKADIISALDWYYAHHYNETTVQFDNWWHWVIGAPLQLNDIMTMLYDDLTPTQRTNYMAAINHFCGAASGTGANRVWTATIVVIQGILVQDATKVAAACDALSPVFPYVTAGDGFYTDGSFIQHSRLPSNGSYGASLIFDIASVMYELSGSPWAVTDPASANIYRWVYDSFEPLIYKGAMADMTEGRGIARSDLQDHVIGQQVIQAILRLAQFAPATDALNYKRMAKYWIQTDTYHNYLTNLPVSDIILAKQVLGDGTITPRGELLGTYNFACMDKMMHLRPGYGFGISMSSNRTFNYESINGENLHGWYTGDGMTYLYNNDLAQYSDDYWATVNPYRLPSTTVNSNTRANSSGQSWLSPATWVGGVTNGNLGTAGMDLRSWNSTLTAKKSWFMFGNEVVALGAGITSTGGPTITTTIDNRKIPNANTEAVVMDGVVQPTTPGSTKTVTGSKWVNIQGTGGYYFPQSESITLLREARAGKWTDITNWTNDPAPKTRNYVSMTVNHGADPANGTYSYVVLPNRTAAQTQAYAAAPQTSIIANTPAVQAARETSQNVLGANFWQPGTASYVTAYTPAATMVRENGSQYTLTASDPTQKQSQLIIELDKTAGSVISKDPSVTVLSLAPTVKVAINVAGAAGKSHNVTLGGVAATGASLLSQGRPVSASTSYGTGLVPANAVDGNFATRWSSAYSDNQWYQVDLGSVQALQYVKLAWDYASGKDYNIQVSGNGTTWRTVVSRTGNGIGNPDTLALPAGTTGRYVRMLGLTRTTQWGFSLWEFQVYGQPNLSQGRPVTASSSAAGLPPSQAVDGNFATRWGSAYSDNQWLQVDLGSIRSLKYVGLNWETAYGKNYNIQISNDGTTWTTPYARTNGTGGQEVLALSAGTKGRYVRMQGVTRGTRWGYSLWEFQVFDN